MKETLLHLASAVVRQALQQYGMADRTYFLINSHCIALYLHYKTTMKPIAIQSQQETLICMLTQQGSLAVAQVVVSLLLFLLIYTICV